MTTTERRRNLRAEHCRACGVLVEASQGRLYRDTNGTAARRKHDRTGRFGWFVKCESCHVGSKTRLTVAIENQPTKPPSPRSWSVSQVSQWTLERGEHEGDVALWVVGSFGRELVSGRDPFGSRFEAPTDYRLEQHLFAGRPLSMAAVNELSPRILAVIVAVQSEEESAALQAVKLLEESGVIAKRHGSGIGWAFSFKGGSFYLYGTTRGHAVVSGMLDGKWIETTVESLLTN